MGRFVRLLMLVAAGLAGAAAPLPAFDELIDSPMYKSPDLERQRLGKSFPKDIKALWLQCLERPEAEYRCQAAHAIATAHRRGYSGLETTVPALIAALDRTDQHPTVRLAVANALVTLDARKAAASLLKQAQAGGSDLRHLVEPALAHWDDPAARALWLQRLAEPATPAGDLTLAIRGLGAVREDKAATRLRELALDNQAPPHLRLEAAQALGSIRGDGLQQDAERMLAAANDRVARLIAAHLLRRHGASAVPLLQRLAVDSDAVVALPAVARLFEIDPKWLVPGIDDLLARPDAALRGHAADVLLKLPSPKHVRLLAATLNDADPEVRRQARRALLELSKRPELRDKVLADTTGILAGANWRGQEQATILLTQLDHKPAAPRLLELLDQLRPEVRVTTAWGLRKLAVAETLGPITKYVAATYAAALAGKNKGVDPGIIDHQLAQLNQFLGLARYQPADAALRQFIPKQPFPECRAAAVWSLGRLHEGKLDAALAKALEARLNDGSSIPPEMGQVRWASAVGLARINAKEALSSLRKYCPAQEATGEPIHDACGWAIEQLSGQKLAPPRALELVDRNWFLIRND